MFPSLFARIPFAVWLVASILACAVADYFSKKAITDLKWQTVLAIVCAYSLASLFWLPALAKRDQLAIVGAMWAVGSLVCTVLIGVVVFGERLNAVGVSGLVVGAVAIVLLSLA